MEHLIAAQIKNVPPLPEGWVYESDFDMRYNYEKRAWEFVATMRPIMKYKVESTPRI